MLLRNEKSRSRGWTAALLTVVIGAPAAVQADVVGDWNLTSQQAVLASPGTSGSLNAAYMHVAIYDAVNAIDGRYSVFAVRPAANPHGASKEAAAASAAYRTLLGLHPAQTAMLDTAYAASLAAVPNGPAKTKGIEIGEEVAAAWLAQRSGDGREANVGYDFSTPPEPGDYQRTLPGPPSPVTPWMKAVRPFVLTSPQQFRAYGPPDVTSLRFAQDFVLTKSLGSATSEERSAEESKTALFHTENPTTFWNHNFRDFAATKKLGIADSARLFAALTVSLSEGIIACWDSKYYYNFWRPITAITTTLDDDNPATETDVTWLPLANTPPHPEYPAAHGCAAGAVSEALEHFFGTNKLQMTFTSSVPDTGGPHVYRTTDDLVEEITWARVFGGMHYLTSTEHGATLGRKVGRYVMRQEFRPVHR